MHMVGSSILSRHPYVKVVAYLELPATNLIYADGIHLLLNTSSYTENTINSLLWYCYYYVCIFMYFVKHFELTFEGSVKRYINSIYYFNKRIKANGFFYTFMQGSAYLDLKCSPLLLIITIIYKVHDIRHT